MTSLDDTLERLVTFRQDLISFRERMGDSLADLSQRHDSLDGLWNDSYRHEYDRAWTPLRQTLETFHLREGPDYEAFLNDKIALLENYLHGR
jgi:hypothetical protein